MLRPSSRKATDHPSGQKGMFSSDFFGAEDPFDDPFFKEPIESFFSLHQDLFQPFNQRRPFGILRSGPHEVFYVPCDNFAHILLLIFAASSLIGSLFSYY